ncbi:MAG TPA: hypothetical protein VN260_01330 [Dissulfurispiraceae bacterium]|nr:hypothetical protein [Dissulfurispiraceae bacterium]
MKKAVVVGMILGAMTGILIALSMDLLLGDSLGGGWKEAMAKDLNHLFKTHFSPDHVVVYIGVFFAIALIGLFGAFFGAFFGLIAGQIFNMLKDRED